MPIIFRNHCLIDLSHIKSLAIKSQPKGNRENFNSLYFYGENAMFRDSRLFTKNLLVVIRQVASEKKQQDAIFEQITPQQMQCQMLGDGKQHGRHKTLVCRELTLSRIDRGRGGDFFSSLLLRYSLHRVKFTSKCLVMGVLKTTVPPPNSLRAPTPL